MSEKYEINISVYNDEVFEDKFFENIEHKIVEKIYNCDIHQIIVNTSNELIEIIDFFVDESYHFTKNENGLTYVMYDDGCETCVTFKKL